GIYVKSFQFAKKGEYSFADLEPVLARVRAGGWQKMLEVEEKEEKTGIYLKTDGKKVDGIVILSAEAQELTLVNIVGSIDQSMIGDLSGTMGIPKIDTGFIGKRSKGKASTTPPPPPPPPAAPPKKDDDEI